MGATWKQQFNKKPLKRQLEIVAENGIKMKCSVIDVPTDIYSLTIRHCSKSNFEDKMPLCMRFSEGITATRPIRVFIYRDGLYKVKVKDYKSWREFYTDWKFIEYEK